MSALCLASARFSRLWIPFCKRSVRWRFM